VFCTISFIAPIAMPGSPDHPHRPISHLSHSYARRLSPTLSCLDSSPKHTLATRRPPQTLHPRPPNKLPQINLQRPLIRIPRCTRNPLPTQPRPIPRRQSLFQAKPPQLAILSQHAPAQRGVLDEVDFTQNPHRPLQIDDDVVVLTHVWRHEQSDQRGGAAPGIA
jgi:hypothetical protein